MGGIQEFPGFGRLHTSRAQGSLASKGSVHCPNQGRCRTFAERQLQAHHPLLDELMQDTGSKIRSSASALGSPAIFETLSKTAFTMLRASEFLFARKFAPNASIPNYESAVLAV